MIGSDVIVIGLGAMGSASVYQLAKRGVRVLGIDRYKPPHSLGSTHGDSRITRQAVGEGPAYVPFVLRSQSLWREIEAETDCELFNRCGVLMMKPNGIKAAQHGVEDRFAATLGIAKSFGIAHEVFGGDEVRRRYPVLQVEENYRAYFEPGGGFVRPEAAVSAQLELAKRHGAQFRYDEEVIAITAEGGGASVTTRLGRYPTQRVVVTAGPWIQDILLDHSIARLFRVYRQTLHWFPIDPDSSPYFSPDRFPVFIWTFGEKPADYMYGFPAINGPGGGLKIATEQYEATTSANRVQRKVAQNEPQPVYDHCVRGRIPALSSQAIRSEVCVYTVTPDYGFVIDQHPDHEHVLLVSSCSGHGFKHSAAIGESVAQSLVEGRSSIDLSPFQLRRFNSEVGSNL